MRHFSTFTSESVSEGHPDKLCDQISDAILDAAFAEDPKSRVAVECLAKEDTLIIAGEVTTEATLGYEELRSIAADVINSVGYTSETGFDNKNFTLISRLTNQTAEIKKRVDNAKDDNKGVGAGDQGMMFGYASQDTENFESTRGMFMPAPIAFAHALMRKHSEVRRSELPGLRPDAKCQLTFEYDEEDNPIRVTTVVVSTQHDAGYDQDQLKNDVINRIVRPIIPDELLEDTFFLINPGDCWIEGGPKADCGLTGRKIIVDTYGGAALHGGGALSGKDPTKVDRSAAYAARHAAKNIVAAGLAKECEIQVSYAIGEPEPTSLSVNTFGTFAENTTDQAIDAALKEVFKFEPTRIIDRLNLQSVKYLPTATFGHFGRADGEFTWEQTDFTEQLREAATK